MANPLVQIILKAKDEISEVIGGITDSLRGFEDKTKEVAYASSLAFDEARYNFEQYGIAMGDMSTEYSGKFDEVTGKLIKFGDESVEVKDKSTGAFDEMKGKIKISFTEINQAIETGMKIAKAAKRVYEATVGKALDIAKEVETLSRISGDAPENISALRIAAQEAGVGFDDLYKALENLNKNGVAPTVENLVALADEYVNLKDPLEKAKLLTENFGSAGDEIAPMLEAVAGGVKEVQNAGLVFTEEDIQAAKDYEQAVVDLENAWENFAVTTGKSALPALTDQLNFIAGTGTRFELIGKYLSLLNQNVKDGDAHLYGYTITLGDFLSMTESGEGVEWLTGQIAILEGNAGDLIQTLIAGSSSFEDFTAKMELYGLGTGGVTEEIYGFMRATYDMTESTESLTEAEIEAAAAAALAAAEQEKLNTTITGSIFDLGKKYTPILAEIAVKQERIAELNQIEEAGGGYLDGVWMSAEQAAEEMSKLETEIQNARLAMQGLAAQAVAGIAWEQITADGKVTLEEITRYYDFLVQTGIMTADAGKQAIQDFMDMWDLWDPEGKTLPVIIDLDTTEVDNWQAPTKYGRVQYSAYDPLQIGLAAGGSVHAAASGVAASLPHYWVGELGPEPFFPSVDGRIVSNTQAMSALRGGAGVNGAEIADAVKRGLVEALRGNKDGIGNTYEYNLSMPTSQSAVDVAMAFDLLRAYGDNA